MILITGGTGFLGSHLTQRLLSEGRSVRLLVRDGSAIPSGWNVLTGTLDVVRGSVTDQGAVTNAMIGVSTVVHLAAIGSPASDPTETPEMMSVNVVGTANVMVAAGGHGVKRVVLASSAAVYGASPTSPKTEDMPLSPSSAYGVSKAAVEQLAEVLGNHYGMSTIALRFFNVYGLGERNEGLGVKLIPRILQSVLSQTPLALSGDGSQERDFVHIDDCTTSITLALKVESAQFKAINVGTGQPTSIKQLVDHIRQNSTSSVQVTFESRHDAGVSTSCASLDRARHLLQFEPEVPLSEGICQLLQSQIKR